jgi:hypothetical protein
MKSRAIAGAASHGDSFPFSPNVEAQSPKASAPSRSNRTLRAEYERSRDRSRDYQIAAEWLSDFTARRKLADLPYDSDFVADVIALDLEGERLSLCVRLLKEVQS